MHDLLSRCQFDKVVNIDSVLTAFQNLTSIYINSFLLSLIVPHKTNTITITMKMHCKRMKRVQPRPRCPCLMTKRHPVYTQFRALREILKFASCTHDKNSNIEKRLNIMVYVLDLIVISSENKCFSRS